MDILEHLNQHRTIRKYSDRKIEPELLSRILETACRASNTGNMQAYSIVVTSDDELKKQLSPLHFNQPMVMDAPVVLHFCADFNRISKWCEQRKAVPGFNNFQSFIAAAIDALLVAQSFLIAAESQGLGGCYLGTATYNAPEIVELLRLPKLVVPVACISLGYPAQTPQKADRLSLEAVVHQDYYKDYSDEAIDEFYLPKEQADFYKLFVAENDKDTLAQVFTDVRYTKKNNELFSEKFLDLLKQQGFLD